MAGLRIMMLTASYTGVGDWYRAWHLGRELTALGQRVTLVSISPDRRWRSRLRRIDGMEHLECPSAGTAPLGHHGDGPLDIAARLGRLLRRRFDVVHGYTHYLDVCLPAFVLRRARGFVFVSDWCDWFSRGMAMGRFASRPALIRLTAAWEDAVRRRADGVTPISRALEQRCLDIGCAPERVHFLPGGAPAGLVRPLDAAASRAACGLEPDAQVAAYLGTPYPEEVGRFLAAAVGLARQRPNLRLLFIGSPKDWLRRAAGEAGLAERVVFAGKVPDDDLPRWLACADFFILPMTDNPYHRSRWPNKTGEYLAAGRPLLASRVGEAARLLDEHPVGRAVGDDPGEIASAMAGLWDDAAGRERMGAAARALAEGGLSWAALADGLLAFYRRLLAARERA